MSSRNIINSNFWEIANSDVNGNIVGINTNDVRTVTSNTTLANISGANVDVLNSNTAFLGQVTNVHIYGGLPAQLLTTDGNGNLSWADSQSTSIISNGSSNVSIPIINGPVAISSGGTPNVVSIRGAGSNSNVTVNASIRVNNTLATSRPVSASPRGSIVTAGGIGAAGSIAAGGYLAGTELILDNGASDNYVAFVPRNDLEESYTLQLPINAGSNGQVLTTDGNGILTWGQRLPTNVNIPGIHFDVLSNGNNQTFSNTILLNYESNAEKTVLFRNGALLTPDYYTLDGAILTINVPLVTGDNIDVIRTAADQIEGNLVIAGDYAEVPPVNFDVTANGNSQSFSNSSLNLYSGSDALSVFVNGSYLSPALYQLVGDTITFLVPLQNGDIINIPRAYANLASNISVLAGGSNTQIQYNSNGQLTGSNLLTFNGNTVTVGANLTATANVNFVSSGNVNLGFVGNVRITGGANGEVLTTDGTGNLYWGIGGGNAGNGDTISNGNSNVGIFAANGNVTVSVTGNADVFTFSPNAFILNNAAIYANGETSNTLNISSDIQGNIGITIPAANTEFVPLTISSEDKGISLTANSNGNISFWNFYANGTSEFSNSLIVNGNVAAANGIFGTISGGNVLVGNYTVNANSVTSNSVTARTIIAQTQIVYDGISTPQQGQDYYTQISRGNRIVGSPYLTVNSVNQTSTVTGSLNVVDSVADLSDASVYQATNTGLVFAEVAFMPAVSESVTERFFAVTNGSVYISADGYSYEPINIVFNPEINNTWNYTSVATGGNVVVVGSSNGNILVSTDRGETWTDTTTTEKVNAIAYNGTKWIAVGDDGRIGTPTVSGNPAGTWTFSAAVSATNDFVSLATIPGTDYWVAGALDSTLARGRYVYSNDNGSSWTASGAQFTAAPVQFAAVGSRFYFTGGLVYPGNQVYMAYIDAGVWAVNLQYDSNLIGTQFTSIAYSGTGTTLYVTSSTGTIYRYTGTAVDFSIFFPVTTSIPTNLWSTMIRVSDSYSYSSGALVLAGSNARIAIDQTISSSMTVSGNSTLNGNLTVSNNATINGNLIVNGTTFYANTEILTVEDPLIQLGTGANGTPLVANDGKDRGMILHTYGAGNTYYSNGVTPSGNSVIAVDDTTGITTGMNIGIAANPTAIPQGTTVLTVNANANIVLSNNLAATVAANSELSIGTDVLRYVGWDVSNGEFAVGSNVSVSNDVVAFNTYGNLRAQTFYGNFVGNVVGNLTSFYITNGNSNVVVQPNANIVIASNSVANVVVVHAEANNQSDVTLFADSDVPVKIWTDTGISYISSNSDALSTSPKIAFNDDELTINNGNANAGFIIDVDNFVEILTDNDANTYDGSTGAFRVSGGVSVLKNIYSNATVSGNILQTRDAGQVRYAANTHWVSIAAPNSIGANYSIYMPAAAATDGQTLTINANGYLSWTDLSYIANGNSNIRVLANDQILMSAGGSPNIVIIDANGYFFSGNLQTAIANGNSNLIIHSNGNVQFSANGFVMANIVSSGDGNVVTSGINIAGYVNALGNVRAANFVGPLSNGNSNIAINQNGNILITANSSANLIRITANATGNYNTQGLTSNGYVLAEGNIGVRGNGFWANIRGNSSQDGNYTLMLPANVGSNGQVLQTDGAGNLNWFTISTSSIANGNSNVSVIANGEIRVGANGVANVLRIDEDTFGYVPTTTGNTTVFIGGLYGNGDATTNLEMTVYSLRDVANIANASSNTILNGGFRVSSNIANALQTVIIGNGKISAGTSLHTAGELQANGNVTFANSPQVNLGAVANVRIANGTNGQVLQTDGAGNLSWITPYGGTIEVTNITQANPAVVTTAVDQTFFDGAPIIITGVNGMTEINGQPYYAQVSGYTSNTFALYQNANLANGVDSTGFNAYTSGGTVTTRSDTGNSILNGNSNVSVLPGSNVIFGVTGNANVVTVTANGIVLGNYNNHRLGNVANIHITGGANGQALITDGNGNLQWGNAGILAANGTNSNSTVSTSSAAGGSATINVVADGANSTVAAVMPIGSRIFWQNDTGNQYIVTDITSVVGNAATISITPNLAVSILSTTYANSYDVESAVRMYPTGNVRFTLDGTALLIDADNSNLGYVENITLTSNVTGTPSNAGPGATMIWNGEEWSFGTILHYQTGVRLATTAALTAAYDNGTSGVGATLTNSGSNAALSIDSISVNVNDRILVKDQANAAHNGAYVVSNAGSPSAQWVLTRAADYDEPTQMLGNDVFYVSEGTVNQNASFVQTQYIQTVGTTDLTFESAGVATLQTVSAAGNSTNVALQFTNATSSNASTNGAVTVGNTSNAAQSVGIGGGNVNVGNQLTVASNVTVGNSTTPTTTSLRLHSTISASNSNVGALVVGNTLNANVSTAIGNGVIYSGNGAIFGSISGLAVPQNPTIVQVNSTRDASSTTLGAFIVGNVANSIASTAIGNGNIRTGSNLTVGTVSGLAANNQSTLRVNSTLAASDTVTGGIVVTANASNALLSTSIGNGIINTGSNLIVGVVSGAQPQSDVDLTVYSTRVPTSSLDGALIVTSNVGNVGNSTSIGDGIIEAGKKIGVGESTRAELRGDNSNTDVVLQSYYTGNSAATVNFRYVTANGGTHRFYSTNDANSVNSGYFGVDVSTPSSIVLNSSNSGSQSNLLLQTTGSGYILANVRVNTTAANVGAFIVGNVANANAAFAVGNGNVMVGSQMTVGILTSNLAVSNTRMNVYSSINATDSRNGAFILTSNIQSNTLSIAMGNGNAYVGGNVIVGTGTGNGAGLAVSEAAVKIYSNLSGVTYDTGALIVTSNVANGNLSTTIANGSIMTGTSLFVGNVNAVTGAAYRSSLNQINSLRAANTPTNGGLVVTSNVANADVSTAIGGGNIISGGTIRGLELSASNSVTANGNVIGSNAVFARGLSTQTAATDEYIKIGANTSGNAANPVVLGINSSNSTFSGLRLSKAGTERWFLGADNSQTTGNLVVNGPGGTYMRMVNSDNTTANAYIVTVQNRTINMRRTASNVANATNYQITWDVTDNYDIPNLTHASGVFTNTGAPRKFRFDFQNSSLATGANATVIEGDMWFQYNAANTASSTARYGQQATQNTNRVNWLMSTSWTFLMNTNDTVTCWTWTNNSTGGNVTVGEAGFGQGANYTCRLTVTEVL